MNLAPPARVSLAVELLKLLRPYQWVKNGFVFVGLLFSQAGREMGLGGSVLFAAAGFCLVSSCVYILNDMLDRMADRAHPAKRKRPLASGTVSASQAFALACG